MQILAEYKHENTSAGAGANTSANTSAGAGANTGGVIVNNTTRNAFLKTLKQFANKKRT
jgi:hypothetical protein